MVGKWLGNGRKKIRKNGWEVAGNGWKMTEKRLENGWEMWC